MKQTEPSPNLVDFAQLRFEGTRTVEVKVRGAVVQVTERLEEDSSVDTEIGRARMVAQRGTRAAQALMASSEDDTPEKKAQQAELVRATQAMDALDAAVTFDRRRVICRRVAGKFESWNVVGPGGPLPLDFDGLYDGPLSTPTLETIYEAVQAEPIVGEASA